MSDKAAPSPTPIALFTRDPVSGAPVAPKHPERICWGCNKYCPENDLACGNGTIRTPHPIELFGDDWLEWGLDRQKKSK